MHDVRIRQAGASDAVSVGRLVFELLEELVSPEPSGGDAESAIRTATALLHDEPRVWAFLAEAQDEPIAVLTLNECAAIYAGGRFGEICEFYVRPRFRGTSIGRRLLDAAVAFARDRAWTRLEVTAAPPPRWQRSLAFYLRSGFVQTGPHLKLEL